MENIVLKMGTVGIESENELLSSVENIPTNNVVVHIEDDRGKSELVSSVRDFLYDSHTPFSSEHCIYRVPENVRKYNEAAYTPQVVSIGPYHHGRGKLTEMEGFKKSYARRLIERSGKSLNDIIKHLEDYKSRVCSCYEGKDPFENCDYLNVVLVDACFVIEYLRRSFYGKFRYPADSIPSLQFLRTQIKRDLALLENQLPFFLLESLFNLLDPSTWEVHEDIERDFRWLVLAFLPPIYNINYDPDFSSVNHFTDLIRAFHKPKKQTWSGQRYSLEYTASATQLYDAGVKFTKAFGLGSLLDIDFIDHYLVLPKFILDDDQESLYRNLMALELLHYPYDTFIVDYFVFMDTLINTSDDVSLLVQSGALLNRIGDHQDAANTFNKFCAGITEYNQMNSYLYSLCDELDAYYKTPKHTWMTTFKRDYFGTPLRTASTIIALCLVILTFISTVCSILSVTL